MTETEQTNTDQPITFEQLTDICQAAARGLVEQSRNRVRFVVIALAADIGGHMVSNFNNEAALSQLLADLSRNVRFNRAYKTDLDGNALPSESPPSIEPTDHVVTIEVSSSDEAKFVEWLVGYGMHDVGMPADSASDFAKDVFGSLRKAGFGGVRQTMQTTVALSAKPAEA